MHKFGFLLCAIAFALAPAGKAAADTDGRIVAVERMSRGGDASLWTLAVPPEIVPAIEGASIATGADFEYLLKTAALESSFNSDLVAKTSTATGLYQFIERTWLLMMHRYGAEAGLDTFASAVGFCAKNGYVVENAALKEDILALRNDVELAALMAAMFARQNADAMTRTLGRAPDSAELYIGHVMGATGGAQLIRLAESKPQGRADHEFRRAARANRTIFYDGRRPRSLREVRDLIVAKYTTLEVRRALPAEQIAGLPAPIRLASD